MLFSLLLKVRCRLNYLTMVDYGDNVRQSEFLKEIGDFHDVDDYASCAPWQLMAWFFIPSIRSLSIWLRSTEGLFTQNE